MGHAIGMRASSMGASALLLGAAVFAALTATYTVRNLPTTIEAPPIISETYKPDPPPQPPIHAATTNEPTSTIDSVLPPLAPPIGDPQPTNLLVSTGPVGPVRITNPYWTQTPHDLERFYPRRALQNGVEGRAVLECQVTTSGALSPCVVVSETPTGWAFGEAALRIASEYRMQPATLDGAPTTGRYRMDVPFAIR